MGGAVTPPSVTMSCPGSTVYGSPPTVTATVNQNATIVFYLDGAQVSSGSGTSASYTPGPSVSVGTHTIEVIVSNANGTDSVICSWVVLAPAPTVTMSCPGSSRYEYPPTFTANANESGTITFYLNNNPVLTVLGSTATYTPPVNTPVGNHIVRVVITNGNGEGSYSCAWSIIPPAPVITLVNPSDSLVIDLEGTERTFIASVNPAIPLDFTIDMNQVSSTIIDESTASISCSQSSGGHNISVFAGNVYGSDTKNWNWIVMGPWIEPKPENLGSRECNHISTSNPSDVLVQTTSTVYHYPDGHCQILVEYSIGACIGSMSAHSQGLGPNILGSKAEITITISWPEISEGNPSNSKAVTKKLGSGVQTGFEALNVPFSSYYMITIEAKTECLGWNPDLQELFTVTEDDVACSIRIPEEGFFT